MNAEHVRDEKQNANSSLSLSLFLPLCFRMKSKRGVVNKMLESLRKMLSCFCGTSSLREQLLREEHTSAKENTKVQESKPINKHKVHFVLVHGSCMGGWCWYKLIPLLESAGFLATAVDLAASGIHPKQVEDLSTFSDYAEPLMEFLASVPLDEKVILVAHSMGGVAAAVAMESFPKKFCVAVFVTAYMPGPNLTPRQIDEMFNLPPEYGMDTKYTYGNGTDKPPTSFTFGPQYNAHRMYQHSSAEDLALGNMLERAFPSFNEDEKSERQMALTEANYGSVPRVFIISGNDNGLRKDLQRMMIDKNPPDEVREIAYSDHMVMCSEPVQLFSHLRVIADKYVG